MSEMTMVEVVALAISGGDDPANILAIHRERARLAIAAMREPTPQMIDAGDDVERIAVRPIWQAMIDEALR